MRAHSLPLGNNVINNMVQINNNYMVQMNNNNVNDSELNKYENMKQLSHRWQSEHVLADTEKIALFIKGSDRALRKVIDSLNIPIIRTTESLYFVYKHQTATYHKSQINLAIEIVAFSVEQWVQQIKNNFIQQIDGIDNNINNEANVRRINDLNNQINKMEKTMDRLESCALIQKIIKMCLSFDDPYKLQLLNNHPFEWPTLNGRILNVRTLLHRQRTIDDYWTFEIRARYLSDLNEENNVFCKFKKSQFEVLLEYEWQKLFDAYCYTPFNHEEIFATKVNKMGANGKDTEITTCKQLFVGSNIIREINQKVITGNTTFNVGAELQKLRGCRIAYFQEIDGGNNIDLSAAKKLASTGMIDERDCKQKGVNVEPFESTHQVISYANKEPVNKDKCAAFARRYIPIHIKPYFRNEGEKGYDDNDDYCRPKDINLSNTLRNNISHCFTYIIDAQHEYCRRRDVEPTFSLKETCPASLQTPPIDSYDKFIDEHIGLNPNSKLRIRQIFDKYAEVRNIEMSRTIESKIKQKLLNVSSMIVIKNHRYQTGAGGVHLSVFGIEFKQILQDQQQDVDMQEI